MVRSMFSKKAIGALLAAAMMVTSVVPTFAAREYVGIFEPESVNYDNQGNYTIVTNAATAYINKFGLRNTLSKENPNPELHLEKWTNSFDGWEVTDKGAHYKSFSANESNNYTIITPVVTAENFIHTGWMMHGHDESMRNNNYIIPAGKSFTFPENWPAATNTWNGNYDLYPVVVYTGSQSANDKIETVSINKGGHTVSANINVTPAYTGSKIKAGDVIESLELDGKKINVDDIKVKVDKNKAVGSEVSVYIKKIKGVDKATNKELKGELLGKVTIRPIVVQELLTSPTKTYSKEGQVYVKAKGSKAKAAYVYVPKKGKYSDSKKVKKIKIKKSDFEYAADFSTIIFIGKTVVGSAVKQ